MLLSWSATLDAFIWNREESWLNQHIFKVTPYEGVQKEYLFYLLKLEIAELVKTEHLHGSTMKHINRGPFLAHKVGLPSQLEQQKIAAKLDNLAARTKTTRAELERIPLLIEHYRESIVRSLLFGCPEEDSLENIIEEGPTNGLYLPKTSYGDGTPILRIENYDFSGSEPISNWKRVSLPPAVVGRYDLRQGDIVINRVNSPSHLGKSLLITPEHIPAVFESNMMRFRIKNCALPEYVQLVLGSNYGRALLTANAKWAVNQASINQSDVCQTVIPLPDIEQQGNIVRKVHAAELKIRLVRDDARRATQMIGALEHGFYKKAFRGELVPQVSAEESAEALLARIRGKYSALPKVRRGRRTA